MIFANNPGDFALFVEEIIPEISGQRGPVEEIELCEDCGAVLDEEGCRSARWTSTRAMPPKFHRSGRISAATGGMLAP